MDKSKLPIGEGKIGYTTSNVIDAPLSKVWEAVTEERHLREIFIDRMEGKFEPGEELVTWHWDSHPDYGMPFFLEKVEPRSRIEFTADSMSGDYRTQVVFEFVTREDGKTIFRVHDKGYREEDLKHAFMVCEGWTEFHSYLKVYLETGVGIMKRESR